MAEWEAIVGTEAVRVLTREESVEARIRYPDRVLASGMVRRLKPQPGVGVPPKATSRWCVHGDTDPDTERLSVYAPTPQSESVLALLQVLMNHGHQMQIADFKNALCQGNPLRRSRGPLSVQPCLGLPLGPEILVQLIAPVYGLDDALVEWHRSITGFITGQLGYRRCLLEPCWFVRHDERGNLVGRLLLDVDDFLFGAIPSELSRVKTALMKSYEFGNWESFEGEFRGRRLRQLDDRILVDQEKYILENMKSVFLDRGRRADHSSPPSDVERRSCTTLIYQLNWVGKETRPEVAGAASLLAARAGAPTVGDILGANAAAQLLISFAAQRMIVWKFDYRKMQLIAVSDCSGAGAGDGVRAQGAWHILAAEGDLQTGVSAKVTPLAWRSTRLRRVVSSTLAREIQVLAQAVFELEWLQLQLRDAADSNVVCRGWQNGMQPYAIAIPDTAELRGSSSQHCMVTDAKSVFDTLLKPTAGSKQDRRSAIDLALLRQVVDSARAVVRWIPHPFMPADIMTKSDVRRGNAALTCLLRSVRWKLVCEK